MIDMFFYKQCLKSWDSKQLMNIFNRFKNQCQEYYRKYSFRFNYVSSILCYNTYVCLSLITNINNNQSYYITQIYYISNTLVNYCNEQDVGTHYQENLFINVTLDESTRLECKIQH